MNFKTPAIFGMAVLVVASSMIGFNFATMFPTSQKASTEALPFLGHVELVAADPDGNIKAYRQSDNVVMRIGKTCAADLIFGENTTASCAGSTRFQHIGIGNNSTAPSEGQTGPQIGLIGSRSIDTAVGLDNATASVGAKSTIDKAFTINGTDTIRIVGLFDTGGSTDATGHAFAKQQLGSAIPVNSGDTVTVKWTVTVG